MRESDTVDIIKCLNTRTEFRAYALQAIECSSCLKWQPNPGKVCNAPIATAVWCSARKNKIEKEMSNALEIRVWCYGPIWTCVLLCTDASFAVTGFLWAVSRLTLWPSGDISIKGYIFFVQIMASSFLQIMVTRFHIDNIYCLFPSYDYYLICTHSCHICRIP